MTVIDKNCLLPRLEEMPELHIEVGCGNRKRNPLAIGIDQIDHECVDLVGDVFEVLKKFPDDSVTSVSSYHFLEHLQDPGLFLMEIQRITRKNAVLEIVVPHFTNPHYYSDYTHKSSYGLYTFCYLCTCSLFRREVPSYGNKTDFRIIDVDLIFKSSPPFYVRHAIKKSLGLFFNLNGFMQEFYEENLCYLLPCYEIRFRMLKC